MRTNNVEAQMKIDMLLRILENLHPYSVTGIAPLLNVSEEKAEVILRFLAKYRIIQYDEEQKIAVICTDFLALR